MSEIKKPIFEMICMLLGIQLLFGQNKVIVESVEQTNRYFSQEAYIDSLLQFHSSSSDDIYLFPIRLCCRQFDSIESVDYVVSSNSLFEFLSSDYHLDTMEFQDMVKDVLLNHKPIFVSHLLPPSYKQAGSTLFTRITDDCRSQLRCVDNMTDFLDVYFRKVGCYQLCVGIDNLKGAIVEQLYNWRILVSDNFSRSSFTTPCYIEKRNYPSSCMRREELEDFRFSFYGNPDFQKSRIQYPIVVVKQTDTSLIDSLQWVLIQSKDISQLIPKRKEVINYYDIIKLKNKELIEKFHSHSIALHFVYQESKWILVEIHLPQY